MPDPAPLDPRFTGNVMMVGPGDKEQPYPPNNLFTDKLPGVPGTDSATRKAFRVWTKTSDGKPAGADLSALDAAFAAESK